MDYLAIFKTKTGIAAAVGWILFAAVMITTTVTKDKCSKETSPAPVVESAK